MGVLEARVLVSGHVQIAVACRRHRLRGRLTILSSYSHHGQISVETIAGTACGPAEEHILFVFLVIALHLALTKYRSRQEGITAMVFTGLLPRPSI